MGRNHRVSPGMGPGHDAGTLPYLGAGPCFWGLKEPLKSRRGFIRCPWYGLLFCQISGGLSKKKRVRGWALDLSQRSKILKACTKASSHRSHFMPVEK